MNTNGGIRVEGEELEKDRSKSLGSGVHLAVVNTLCRHQASVPVLADRSYQKQITVRKLNSKERPGRAKAGEGV